MEKTRKGLLYANANLDAELADQLKTAFLLLERNIRSEHSKRMKEIYKKKKAQTP